MLSPYYRDRPELVEAEYLFAYVPNGPRFITQLLHTCVTVAATALQY